MGRRHERPWKVSEAAPGGRSGGRTRPRHLVMAPTCRSAPIRPKNIGPMPPTPAEGRETSRAPVPRAHTVEPGPLSADHLRTLARARARAGKVRRAATIASLSGWSMAVFAAITLIGAILSGWVSLVLGAGLAWVAYNELRGGAMLRILDPEGAKRLGYNQAVLGGLIVLYSSWSLFASLRSPALAGLGGSTGDPHVDEMVGSLAAAIAFGVYGTMAILGVVVPGLTAWYYFSRARIVRSVLAETPPWAIEALRAAA